MNKIYNCALLCLLGMFLFPVLANGQHTFHIKVSGDKPVISMPGKVPVDLTESDWTTKVKVSKGLKFVNDLPEGYKLKIMSDTGKILNEDPAAMAVANKNYTLRIDGIKFLNIEVLDSGNKTTMFNNIGKDFKEAPAVGTVAVESADASLEAVKTGNDAAKKPLITNSQAASVEDTDRAKLYKIVQNKIDNGDYKYVGGQANIIIDAKGTIQIFLDEDANPIYNGYPTTARSNYDKFQFHILTKTLHSYAFDTNCTFEEIKISDEVSSQVGAREEKYLDIPSQIFSPCSNTFTFKISKDGTQIVDWTIKLLKTSRVSVGTSVIASWLHNPENIATFIKPDGTQTLIADNPDTRAYLGLFLTFHFIPRNLNIQPRRGLERFGASIGTNLNDKSFQNFFVGLNYEVTNGLFLNGGLHYGQINYVIGNEHFKYGEDLFNGTLEIRKKWEIGGPYMSVNVDVELFAKVFKNILSPAASVAP